MNSRAITFAVAAITASSSAADVYSGYDTTYTYAGFGDITLDENQDRITDNVWITRDTTRGIFNIAQEPAFQGDGNSSPSPVGTLWAFGTTDDFDTLDYVTWVDLHGGSPFALLDQNVVVYLTDDDSYIDLRFTQWGGRTSGGAFSYVRATIPAPASIPALAFGALMVARRQRP